MTPILLTLHIGDKYQWYSHPLTSIQARNPFEIHGTEVTILMSRGGLAVVDLADFPRLAALKWGPDGGSGYAQSALRVGDGQIKVRLHRYLFGPEADGWYIDHADGNRWRCVRKNLRKATPFQNCLNRGPNASNPYGFKGVILDPKTQAYFAQIKCHGKKHRSGCFSSPQEAAREYDRWARRLFGEFARLNFPGEYQGTIDAPIT